MKTIIEATLYQGRTGPQRFFTERMIHIRELLSSSGPLSTSEIADGIRESRSKVIHTLRSLESSKVIRRASDLGEHMACWALRCHKPTKD